MRLCISEEHKLPHELPCPCCVLCSLDNEIEFKVLIEEPEEALTAA